MELVLLGGQEALLLLASTCPKGHCPAKPSAPCRSEGPHEKAGLEPRAAQLGTPARLLPRLCSLCLYSCCQVRKHCEWCRALICRHEKPSALLKGRTACCHSETGKGLLSEGAFSPLGDTIGWRKQPPSPGQGRDSWRMKQEEKEEGIYPTKSGLVYSKVFLTQKGAL